MYYVNQRWLGGLLTNMLTVQKSIKRLKELDAMATKHGTAGAKKEVIRLERERKHLDQNLAGIKDMNGLPDVLFVIDSNKEAIAVKEARKLGIPVVAVVDTNCDPGQGGLRDSGQRRRAARHPPVHQQDRRRGGRRPPAGQRAGLRGREDHHRRDAGRRDPRVHAQYVDPKYAEQLMSESMPDEDLPSMSLPARPPSPSADRSGGPTDR